LRSSRDDYEFEMLDDAEDDEGGARAGMLNGAAGGKRKARARRGGELYDAFAGESDEDLLSDSEGEDGPYRDQEDREYDEKEDGETGSDGGESGGSGSSAGKRQ
jgi:kexin